MNQLATIQPDSTSSMVETAIRLVEGQHASTARNYVVSIRQYDAFVYENEYGYSAASMAAWLEFLKNSGYSDSSIEAKMYGVRCLFSNIRMLTIDPRIRMIIDDIMRVTPPKKEFKQDERVSDYGVRLTVEELDQYIASFVDGTEMGYRNAAAVALMGRAGLRRSEVVKLTIGEAFDTYDDKGNRGIYINRSKNSRSRIVALSEDNLLWKSLALWMVAADLSFDDKDSKIILPLRWYSTEKKHKVSGVNLTSKTIENVVRSKMVERNGETIPMECHSLRRTYGAICYAKGMALPDIALNMGHSSVEVTMRYIGVFTDLTSRRTSW